MTYTTENTLLDPPEIAGQIAKWALDNGLLVSDSGDSDISTSNPITIATSSSQRTPTNKSLHACPVAHVSPSRILPHVSRDTPRTTPAINIKKLTMHGSATIASAAALLAAAPFTAAAAAAQVSSRQAGGAPCKDVHVFLARGNNEPYPGRQGKLVEAVCSGLDSCDYEDIQFYNPLESPYCGSVEEGAANGIKQIKAYNERCPDAKLVVSGYSQGGHVLGDVLAGGGGVFFQDCVQKPNAPLGADTPAAKKSESCHALCAK